MKRAMVIVLIAFSITCSLEAVERAKPKISSIELSDPNSQNYVPHPYPKSRDHVIADFKYWVRHHFMGRVPYGDMKENITVYERVLPKLIEKDSMYRIGRVYRVYNLSHILAHDHNHVLEVMDLSGNCWGHAALSVEGLFMGIGLDVKPLAVGTTLSADKVKLLLKESGVIKVSNGKEKLKRLGSNTLTPYPWLFSWRIRSNGDEYYLRESHRERNLYKVQSRREWRLDRKSNDEMAALARSMPKGDKMILDSINDQVIVVTPVKIDIEKLLKDINAG